MILFKNVKIKNFMSFGNVEACVDLNTKNTRVILGENMDIGETGMSANGVGKTTIFNAVIFALFGQGIDKLKADEYINITNGKGLSVELEFEKAGKTYILKRTRKPNTVSLTEDGVSLTLDAMRNTDEAVEALIGFNYEIFMASFFLSPHRKSFMSMSGPEQRSMIENMLSLNTLAQRAEALKKIRDDVKVDIKVGERDLQRAEASNETISNSIERLREKESLFETNRINGLNALRAEKEELDSTNFDELRAIFDEYSSKKECLRLKKLELAVNREKKAALADEYRELSAALKSYNSLAEKADAYDASVVESTKESRAFMETADSLESLENLVVDLENKKIDYETKSHRKAALLREKASIEKEIARDTKAIEELEKEIEEHRQGKCHVCGGDYVDEHHLTKTEENLVETIDRLKEATASLSDIDKELVDVIYPFFKTMVEIEQPYIDVVKAQVKEYINHQAVLSGVGKNQFREELDKTKKPSEDDIDVLVKNGKELSKCIEQLDDLVAELASAVSDYEDVLNDLRISKKEHIDEMEKMTIDIVRAIESKQLERNPFTEEVSEAINSIQDVSSIENLLKELQKKETHIGYLIKLLTDSKSFIRKRILENYVPFLNKKINEHAEKLGLPHVCEINSDLSVDLTYMNKGVSYYNLSRGERLRLDIATTEAFRAVMGMLGKGCNLALLDEVLDSALDASGIKAALSFICTSAETVLLVTHRTELSDGIDDKLMIIKQNGFARIE